VDINATLIGQMITFAIFIWFSLKFVWPMIKFSMNERKKKIIDGLDAAKKGHEKLKKAEEKSKKYLKEAREQSDNIIANAHKQANKIIEDSRTDALREKRDIINSGYKQIEQETNRVRLELQKKMANLIISGAEKVLSKSISSKDHSSILEEFIKKL